MPSLRKKPNSKFWYACFTLPDGTRVQRSTKTDKRREALDIARDYERVTKTARTETQARKVISEIFERVTGQSLGRSTIREFLESWLASKKAELGPTSLPSYGSTVEDFLSFMGEEAERDMVYLNTRDVSRFRDYLTEKVSVSSVNKKLKIIRSALKQAWMQGLITENPAGRVANIRPKSKQSERRPFTLEELQKLIEAADGEWKGMILFGLYTGQRLGDIATLQWQNVDLERRELKLTTEKTSRRQILPLAKPLRDFILSMAKSQKQKDHLFPIAAEVVNRTGLTGTLSGRFYRLMVKAGVAVLRTNQKTKDGRSGKRSATEVSFHSLRHTATSLLKNAGVSPAIVQEFVGHESKAVSQNYTHIEFEALQKAADALPILIRAGST